MNKKILIIVLIVVILAFVGYKAYYNYYNKEYLWALEEGSEILKEKFPDIIDDNTQFVAYFHDDIWHIQNIYLDDMGNKIDSDDTTIYENIDKVKYVKIDVVGENFTNTDIFIGDYYTENVPYEVEFTGDEIFILKKAEWIVRRLFNKLCRMDFFLYQSDNSDYFRVNFDKETPEGEMIYRAKYPSGIEITFRRTDGMILFIHNYGF